MGSERFPLMQSLVAHFSQIARSFAFTSRGERVDATKLNCPIGQTNLQNAACLKSASTASAATKYPSASVAVQYGEDHKSNNSYTNRIAIRSNTEIHLFRSACGQFHRGVKNFRATLRTKINGHAKQKKFPAASRTKTRAPRK